MEYKKFKSKKVMIRTVKVEQASEPQSDESKAAEPVKVEQASERPSGESLMVEQASEPPSDEPAKASEPAKAPESVKAPSKERAKASHASDPLWLPLFLKLKKLFVDGIQASDFPKAALICITEAETIGRVHKLSGKAKLELVGDALLSATGDPTDPAMEAFVRNGLPLIARGAILANKMTIRKPWWICC